ncbi:hypothetical protein OG496_55210 [Streptomyces sp. NBC_00988]|nr:hypothetical protein OG496_00075 [Streptomyces sp. NBC_00988]WSX17743.1 hypothetical protein OG496_55210 [Streptomyces sp. NBC_00988]
MWEWAGVCPGHTGRSTNLHVTAGEAGDILSRIVQNALLQTPADR